jgi:hypothetical protein
MGQVKYKELLNALIDSSLVVSNHNAEHGRQYNDGPMSAFTALLRID